MHRRVWTVGLVIAIIAATASLLGGGAANAQSQVLNPLFVQARALMQQVAQGPVAQNVRGGLQSKFNQLSSEQQNLWRLAGDVDRKACTGSCVASYNNRIVAWQRELQTFNAEAAAALRTPQNARTGCITAGSVRPSTVPSLVLWNFANSCNETKHVSVCAQYGNGQNNPLGTDVGPRNSSDITLRAGSTNLCWREGLTAICPCPRR